MSPEAVQKVVAACQEAAFSTNIQAYASMQWWNGFAVLAGTALAIGAVGAFSYLCTRG